MAAIRSLQTALRGISKNPVLFLGGLILGLVVLPQTAAQLAQIPLVPLALQVVTFFITPFIAAGIYGMADEAVESDTSRTSLSTLTDVGREKYVPLLLANFVELGIALVFGFVILIFLSVFVFAFGLGGLAMGGSDVALGGGVLIVGLVFLLLVLAFIVVNFFIQFFPVAVVVGDAGAIEAFGESYRLVRENIIPTLGYSVIQLVAGIIVGLPVTGFIFFRMFQNIQTVQNAGGVPGTAPTSFGFSMTEIVAITAIALATQMILTAFQYTYSVAFFEAHESSPAEPSGPDIDGDSVIPQFE